jgi:hypothetical protein
MYSASSFAVGAVAHAGAITSFGRVWVCIGLAAWAVVFVATIGRAVDIVRSTSCGRRRHDQGSDQCKPLIPGVRWSRSPATAAWG